MTSENKTNIHELSNKYYKLLNKNDYAWAKQNIYPIWFEMLLDMNIGFGIERITIMQLIHTKAKNERNRTN